MHFLPIRMSLPRLTAFAFIISLGCLLAAAWLGLTARNEATAKAARDMTSLADALERQITADLALFDLVLREAAHAPDTRTRVLLPEHPLLTRYAGFINLLNENGEVTADSRPAPLRPANYAGRDYFQTHLRAATNGLMIGRPFATGPNQQASIPLSRRLSGADGGFAGVVVAGIRLSWLHDILNLPTPGARPSLTIRREDGMILMRAPFDPDGIGRSGAIFSPDSLPADPDPSGDLRLSRRMGASGLVLEMTLERAALLAQERSWLAWLLALTVLPSCAVLGLSLLVHRLQRHGARIEAAARHANEERLCLLATMSHELRTPLTGIIGQAELLRAEGGFNPRQAERLARLTEAGALMRLIVNRVIDVTRPDDPVMHTVLASCDLDLLVRTCRSRIEDEARAKGLRLTSHVTPSAPRHAMLDRGLLEQVLGNLLANAVKYTAQGTIELRLAHDAAFLRFEVTDTGSGIARHKKHRLFRAYDRLDMGDSPIEGTGLGLAITERLVKGMGGRIGHRENPGGGSVFWVALPPAVEAAAPPPPATQPPEDTAQTPASPARPLRILLADDLDVTRVVAADFLRAAGHEVIEVPDGETAVRLAGEQDFDVILTDMRMPGHDGLETTRRIRALPGPRGHVPVVLVTADLAARDLETSGATGLTACLMKPFTRAGLLAATEAAARMMASRSTSPETISSESPPAPLLDGAILADLHATMGADAVEAHFHAAARRIEALLTLLDTARAAGGAPVGDAVHDLVGVTGLLGLSALSACLRRFETHDDPAALSALRESAAGSLLALRRRQEAAALH